MAVTLRSDAQLERIAEIQESQSALLAVTLRSTNGHNYTITGTSQSALMAVTLRSRAPRARLGDDESLNPRSWR